MSFKILSICVILTIASPSLGLFSSQSDQSLSYSTEQQNNRPPEVGDGGSRFSQASQKL